MLTKNFVNGIFSLQRTFLHKKIFAHILLYTVGKLENPGFY